MGLDMFNIPNVFMIRYFCQEQSRSRLKCSVLQKNINET